MSELNLTHTWEQKVLLDESKKQMLPLGNSLLSRLVVAIVLTYSGSGPHIMQLL